MLMIKSSVVITEYGQHYRSKKLEKTGRYKSSSEKRCNSLSFRSFRSSSPTVYCPSFGATAIRSQSYKSVFPSCMLQQPSAHQNMTAQNVGDFFRFAAWVVDIHGERYLQMSFSSTLVAGLLTFEPESGIGEAWADVVAIVEESQSFLMLLDCGEGLDGGVEEERPILIAEQDVTEFALESWKDLAPAIASGQKHPSQERAIKTTIT